MEEIWNFRCSGDHCMESCPFKNFVTLCRIFSQDPDLDFTTLYDEIHEALSNFS